MNLRKNTKYDMTRGGCWDYTHFNYCMTCRLKHPKETLRCKECGNKIRSKSQYKTGQRDHKRI